jgi:hypothetical protein
MPPSTWTFLAYTGNTHVTDASIDGRTKFLAMLDRWLNSGLSAAPRTPVLSPEVFVVKYYGGRSGRTTVGNMT